MLHVSDDTNDRDPVNLGVTRPADSFADRIFILKILAHQHFIRDANQGGFLVKVWRRKIAPALQRDLHDSEVVAQHAASLDTRFVAGRNWRAVLDKKIVIE